MSVWTETVSVYCPNPDCRHEWEAEFEHDYEAHYHDLTDAADGICPECGTDGIEERPVFEDEDKL